MGNSTHMQITFLPWLKVHPAVEIGPVTLWSFWDEVDLRVEDANIREHLRSYFRCYVDYEGHPVESITVCSTSAPGFRPLTDDEQSGVRRAVDALLFATIAPSLKRAICKGNRSMGPPSANVFQPITWNFRPGDTHIPVSDGSVCHSGWEIGEITFQKPYATGGVFGTRDEELVGGFHKCLLSQTVDPPARERLFRSLEWFRLAHVEGGQTSPLSRLVMMSTAFEILLEFPDDKKREHFACYMDEHTAYERFIHLDREVGKPSKPRRVKHSSAGWWAWEFYALRNRIIHGDQVSPTELVCRDRITHLTVADLMMLEHVRRRLLGDDCLGDSIREDVCMWDNFCPNEPAGSLNDQIIRAHWRLDEIYEALGWLKPPDDASCIEDVGGKRINV